MYHCICQSVYIPVIQATIEAHLLLVYTRTTGLAKTSSAGAKKKKLGCSHESYLFDSICQSLSMLTV